MRYFFLLILCGIFCINSFAQTTDLVKEKHNSRSLVQIGDKRIKTSHIQPGTDKYILFRVSKGKKQPLSFLTRTIKIEQRNDAEVIIVEQRYDSADVVNTDISVLHRKTLDSLSYMSKLADQTESFEFTSAEVKGTITDKDGKIRQLNVPLKEPVFNAVVQDELIQSLPLGKNKIFSFRSYNPGKRFFDMTARVIGSEILETVNGNLDTWTISLEGSAVPTKIWVTKKTQELIQKKSELPNGDEFWQVRVYV